MILEFAIGSGDPNTAQVTVTASATKLSLDTVATRPGLKFTINFLCLMRPFLDDDQFFVLKTTDAISAAGFTMLQEASRHVFQRPMLVLDSGVTLASLTRSQLRARMGLA